jgi:hypothetical protein
VYRHGSDRVPNRLGTRKMPAVHAARAHGACRWRRDEISPLGKHWGPLPELPTIALDETGAPANLPARKGIRFRTQEQRTMLRILFPDQTVEFEQTSDTPELGGGAFSLRAGDDDGKRRFDEEEEGGDDEFDFEDDDDEEFDDDEEGDEADTGFDEDDDDDFDDDDEEEDEEE